nr:Qat anti-phage system associated protein QatB [Sedimentibacter sp.]
MGTSTSNNGQNGRTPMVPSWLDENDEGNNVIPTSADSERFSNPRNNFTRYINSGGRNRDNLHNATSQYVKQSLGGAKNAVTRLGAARNSTARLISVLGSISGQGIREAGKKFGLGDLLGKNASDVFLEIIDFVCPDGGRTDEGIARSSYIETIESMPELNVTLIENMTENQFLIFTETYMTNVIQERLLNDIGNKTISLPDDVSTVEIIQEQLNDFIFGAVSDAMVQLNIEIKSIDSTQTRAIVDSVYEKAYLILASMEEV